MRRASAYLDLQYFHRSSSKFPAEHLSLLLEWFTPFFIAIILSVQYFGSAALIYFKSVKIASSETQGQSVGPGEKARRNFSSTCGRAPGYRFSPDHFQTVKRILAPDWAQKMLSIIVPNRRTASPEFFLSSYMTAIELDHGLSGSCTKEMHAIRKLLVWYKLSISKYCLPEN